MPRFLTRSFHSSYDNSSTPLCIHRRAGHWILLKANKQKLFISEPIFCAHQSMRHDCHVTLHPFRLPDDGMFCPISFNIFTYFFCISNSSFKISKIPTNRKKNNKKTTTKNKKQKQNENHLNTPNDTYMFKSVVLSHVFQIKILLK